MKKNSEIILKPWGREIKITDSSDSYCGKIIYLNAKESFSLHYHEDKNETLSLFSGKAFLEYGDSIKKLKKVDMKKLVGYQIAKKVMHRIVAVENCVIFETSEPEKGMTIRLEDKYKRSHEDDRSRASGDRGWEK